MSIAFDDVIICRDLALDVERGVAVGVVGENGAGKSRLLSAIADEAARQGVLCVLVTQDEIHVPWLASIDPRLAARFNVVDDIAALERFASASPGQKRRALLAAALSLAPDLLLLDEPSNHLDDDARDALIDAVRAARGGVLIASHDRALLLAVSKKTVVLHRGEHLLVDGDVDVALSTFERTLNERRGERGRALAAVDDAKRQLGAARSTASQVQHQRRTKTRMKSPKDHDARGMLQKGRVIAAEHKAGRTVEVKRRALERAEAAVDDVAGAPKTLGRSFFVEHRLARQRFVASVHGPLMASSFCVRERVDVDVGRSQRLRLLGPNGSGKTTLLAALLQSSPVADEVLLLPQSLDDPLAARHTVAALPRDERGRALQALAALGVDPERVMASSSPSMGEAKKLSLALAFARQVPALFLDEPTNHLDLPSISRLAAALAAFPGAIVLVTHDDAFAAAANVDDVFDVTR